MARKEKTQRIMDVERGTVGAGGQVTAAVTASGPAVGTSPPPTDLTVLSNVLILSAQTPMARISLQWRKPLLAQEVRLYQVQVATNSGFTTGVIYFNASDTSISIDVVTNTSGIAYWFRVRVLSGGIVSDWSSSVTATATADTTPAGLPTSVAYDWDAGDLVITWVNPTSTNLKDVEVRIWNGSGKTVLYHTGYSSSQRYAWTLPQQRIDTAGSLDPTVFFELRSRTWSNVLGTSTTGVSATNSTPSAPTSVSFIQSPGSITISVSHAALPSDFLGFRYRIIQTLPSAADVTFDDPSALAAYSVYAQATYQVGVKIRDVYTQASSETLSSATIVDTLTIGALRADVIYSDNDGNSDATLHIPLSNDVLSSGGITYSTTSTWNKWVRAERPFLERYRTVTLSMNNPLTNTSWYLRFSSDGSTWAYYAGPLTGSVLTLVANAAAAQAASVSAGTLGGPTTSRVQLPATIEARFIEVWIKNTSSSATALYEFYPRRVVEADDIYVQNLAAISADMGSITAGTITGATIQTATSGSRVVLNTTGITTYDSSNVVQITATTATNGRLTFGAGAGILDKDGLRLATSYSGGLPTTPVSVNAIEWVNGSDVQGLMQTIRNLGGGPGGADLQTLSIAANGSTLTASTSLNRVQLTAGGTNTSTDAASIILQGGATLPLLSNITLTAGELALTGAFTLSTWTVSYYGASTGGTTTYSDRNGSYVQIGNIVFFTIYLNWTAATGTGAAVISLPFTAASTPPRYSFPVYSNAITFSGGGVEVLLLASTNYLQLTSPISNSTHSTINIETVGDLAISGFYFV